MKFILCALFALPYLALSHDDHDWRTDYQAYLSVAYELPMSYGKNIPSSSDYKRRLDMDFFKEKLITFSNRSDRRSTENLDAARAFFNPLVADRTSSLRRKGIFILKKFSYFLHISIPFAVKEQTIMGQGLLVF